MEYLTPTDLLEQLNNSPQVKAVLRYGAPPVAGHYIGDLDLFVITYTRPVGVESVHVYAGDTPVDLNIRSVTDLRSGSLVSFIDCALQEATVLFDRNGDISTLIAGYLENAWASKELDVAEIQFERFSHQHLIDKVRNRLQSDPLLSNFLLSTNIYWLIQSHFRNQGIAYPGEKRALALLKTQYSAIWSLVNRFFAATDLSEKFVVTQNLTEQILEPIGGPWRKDEVLVLAAKEDQAFQPNSFIDEGKEFLFSLLGK